MSKPTVKFQVNAVRVNGKRYKVSYSHQNECETPNGTIGERITVYGDGYGAFFPAELRELVEVKNNSDLMTDYFEHDRFVVTPDHRLWGEVLAAHLATERYRVKCSETAARKRGRPDSQWHAERRAAIDELEARHAAPAPTAANTNGQIAMLQQLGIEVA